MANAEAVNAGDRLPSKQSQGERYVDGVGAVELELAIYERLEKARKVECDLAKDEQNRSDSRKQKLCIVAMLLLAILALAIGLTRGIDQQPAGVGTSNSSESKLNHPSTTKITVDDPVDSSEVKTDGPFTRDDLSIMLVGLPSETDLTSEATHILEGKYCSFFEEFYKEPRELDWLRSNIDITECSVEVLEIKRRRLNEDMSTGGLVVELNQTLMLEYPNTGNFTLTKASIDYVVSAPFKDDIAVASFVKNLKNQSSTDEFSSLKDILFAPQSTATADSQAPVSLPTVATQSPSKIPSIGPITSNPTKAPTPKPTDHTKVHPLKSFKCLFSIRLCTIDSSRNS